MAPPYRRYVKSMAHRFNYFANWLPGAPRSLGDIGTFQKSHNFRKVGQLSDLGIDFDTKVDVSEDDLSHQSEKGVSVTIGAGGDVAAGSPAEVKAKIGFEFSAKGAFVFETKGVKYQSIANLLQLSASITDKLGAGVWKPEWAVVTELAEANSCTVLISSSRSAEIDLSAEGNIPSSLNIADASLGLTVTRQKDMATKILSSGPMQPLFRVHGCRKKFLGGHGDFGPLEGVLEGVAAAADDYTFRGVSPAEIIFYEDEEFEDDE